MLAPAKQLGMPASSTDDQAVQHCACIRDTVLAEALLKEKHGIRVVHSSWLPVPVEVLEEPVEAVNCCIDQKVPSEQPRGCYNVVLSVIRERVFDTLC